MKPKEEFHRTLQTLFAHQIKSSSLCSFNCDEVTDLNFTGGRFRDNVDVQF